MLGYHSQHTTTTYTNCDILCVYLWPHRHTHYNTRARALLLVRWVLHARMSGCVRHRMSLTAARPPRRLSRIILHYLAGLLVRSRARVALTRIIHCALSSLLTRRSLVLQLSHSLRTVLPLLLKSWTAGFGKAAHDHGGTVLVS